MKDQTRESKVCLTLRTANQSDFVSYLVAGAYELRARGIADIAYDRSPSLRHLNDRNAFAWFDCKHKRTEETLRICVDLVDYRELPSVEAIEACDVYLKRSYCTDYIGSLSSAWRNKILPLGIHVPYTSEHESSVDRIRRSFQARPKTSVKLEDLRSFVAAPFRDIVSGLPIGRRLPPALRSLPAMPPEMKREGVYFRTRVFDPGKNSNPAIRNDLESINQNRIDVVRALREAFGTQYMGGIYETPAARKLCPELIHEMPHGYSGRGGHLRLSREYLVNVNTTGISNSTPWKFPEILSSGSALVSEPPRFAHQSVPVSGQHYVAFQTPDDCVQACRTLLDTPELAYALANNGRTFYLNEIDPPNAWLVTLERIGQQFLGTSTFELEAPS